ncbi:MAG: ribosome biogenesis GTPase YlqF [Lachnospiraceae bacterium]|nr:ribosome biogenesis GTPase YlqF [Lachnospiraceae bacterium]
MQYQWYPGHMTKTVRDLKESLKLIDLVIEITDARIPLSGRNPDLDRLAGGKARIMLFGKADLADPEVTELWADYFREEGIAPVVSDLRQKSSLRLLTPVIRAAMKEKLERDARRGITGRPVRAMVAGIPNVGKSTFINSFSGSKSLKTGNRPGVTRGRQWIRMGKEVELLDTPGLLWPKFEDEEIGKKIALIGSMPDDILDRGELALELLARVTSLYPGLVSARYGVDETGDLPGLIESVGAARGCLRKGGAVDTDKAAGVLLDDFRSGRLGRISLEKPPVRDS